MSSEGAARAACTVAAGCASAIGLSIPIAPAAIAMLAAFLVRAPLIKRGPGFWVDLSLTILAVLGAFVTVVDHEMGAGLAFWTGIGFGAMGSGMIEIGKNMLSGALKERFQAAGRVLFGIKDGGPPPAP